MTAWTFAAKAEGVLEGTANMVTADGRLIALYRIGADIFASDGFCPHEGQCLDSGFVENGTVECSLHYAVFEITTGAMISGPETRPLPVYPVKVEGGEVFVGL
ncbi:MAG: Rieske (2Fe-2S) protein [Sphingomonadales bacterium]